MADAAEEPEVPESVETPEVSAADNTPDAGASGDSAPASTTSEAPAESQAAVAAAPSFNLREYLKTTAGLDLSGKYQSDEDAAKGLKEALSLIGKKSEKERTAEQIIAWHQQQAALAQQAQAAQQQQPQANPLWSPPPVKETDKRWIEKDPETGVSRVRDNAPLDVRQRLEAFQSYYEDYQYKLSHNPAELFAPVLEQTARQAEEAAVSRVLHLLQAERAQQAEQQTISEIKAAREALFWAKDGEGNAMVGFDGQRIPSDYGRAWIQRETELYQAGLQDHRVRDKLAHEYAEAVVGKALGKPAPQKTPGASKANTTNGGKVNPGGERTHGSRNSLAAMIMAENPDLKDDDVVGNISFK